MWIGLSFRKRNPTSPMRKWNPLRMWLLQIVKLMQIVVHVGSVMRRHLEAGGDIVIGRSGEMNVRRRLSNRNVTPTGIALDVVSVKRGFV